MKQTVHFKVARLYMCVQGSHSSVQSLQECYPLSLGTSQDFKQSQCFCLQRTATQEEQPSGRIECIMNQQCAWLASGSGYDMHQTGYCYNGQYWHLVELHGRWSWCEEHIQMPVQENMYIPHQKSCNELTILERLPTLP